MWEGITQGTNSVNLHVVLYSTAEQNMVYFVKCVLLSRLYMSKFQRQNKKYYVFASSVSLGKGTVPLCKPAKNNGGF